VVTVSLETIINDIDSILKAKDETREKVITHSREVIRRAGSSVLAVHKRDKKALDENMDAAKAALEAALDLCRVQQEYYYVGPMPQAFQEYAEAACVRAMVAGKPLPKPSSLGIPVEPYTTGLADAVGEMRRYALDSLRRDDLKEAERALGIMEEIYTALKGFDFPRAVVPNLRRKVDVMRRLLEETRGDVTLAQQGHLIRESIEKALKATKQ
jgi:translin